VSRAEIEQLEMQEAQQENELDQDIDESRKMLALYTLRVLHKELLAKHQELASIKNAQVTSVQRAPRAYGAD
jgi:hypothetical protein